MPRKRKIQNDVDDDAGDEDVEEILDRNVKKLKQRNVMNNKNCGTIKSIRLKNFLCHSNLNFDFDDQKQIMFITGRNGSGKSAILAGIVVGLGGKATTMNRGKSVKDYIKTGCNAAEISIVFCNDGADAFMPDKYGKSITIERKMTANGTGGYKMKSDKGVIISDKHKDVVFMLDYFNIQLDNPITVLSQDTSRQFLQTSKPASLYQFFMRSTELEQTKQHLSIAQQNMEQAKTILETRSVALPRIREEVKQLSERIQRHDSLRTLRTEIALALKELAWAKYYDQEKIVAEYNVGLKGMNDNLDKHTSKRNEITEDINKFEQDSVDLTAKISDFQRRLEEINSSFQNAERLTKAASNSFESKQREISAIKAEIDNQKAQVQDLRQQIEESNDPNMELHKKKSDGLALLENKKTELANKKQELITIDKEIEQSEPAVRDLQDQKSNLNAEKNSMINQMKRTNETVRSIEAASKGKLEKFGRGSQKLADLINKSMAEKKFKRKPRGPLGASVKLSDEKWALSVESCLGGLCFAYACDNFDDSRLLETLMKECLERRPTIITSPFGNEESYDVSRNTPDCEYPTVLSVLQIDDPVVYNCLIDDRSIESIILFDDNAAMRKYMHENPPSGVSVAYSVDGSQCFSKPKFRFYPPSRSNAYLLSVVSPQNVESLKTQAKNMLDSVARFSADIKKCSADLEKQETTLNSLRTNSKNLSNAIRSLDAYCSTLRHEIDNIVIPDNDLTLYENEISICNGKIETLERDLNKAKQDREGLHKDMKEKRIERDRLKSICDAMHGDNEKERQELSRTTELIAKRKQALTKVNETIGLFEAKIKDWLEKMEVEQVSLQKVKDEAITVCKCSNPIVTQRPAKIVAASIDRLQNQLATGEEEIGNFDQLRIRYDTKRSKLEHIEQERNRLIKLLNVLKSAIEYRNEGFRNIRSMISAYFNIAFIGRLHLRPGYEGKLLISHKNETIEIKVITYRPRNSIADVPTDDRRVSQTGGRDLKALSGGERSYSTICFIVSLWTLTSAPFRCLDEFDVFMDMVSRKLAMDVILDCSQRFHSNNQFILLTPMDVNSLVDDRFKDRVAIYQLSAPRDNRAICQKRPIEGEDSD